MVQKALLGQVSDTDVRLLRIFRAVVACGGLAAAELELNIGRSTISRHLKDLEVRLGLTLCRRGRAGFALTLEGQQVHDSAQRLLRSLDGFRDDVRALHDEVVGTLHLGLFDKTASNPAARVSQALASFRRAAPQASVDITVGTLSDIESAVIDARLHVGVVPDHRRSDSLQYLPLFDETMYLYCSQTHPLAQGRRGQEVALSLLQQHDYAGLAFHSPNMEATHRFGLRRSASASDQEGILILVLSGLYLGFLPDHYAAPFEADGRIVRLGPADCMYQVRFVAVSRRTGELQRVAETFLAQLQAVHAG